MHRNHTVHTKIRCDRFHNMRSGINIFFRKVWKLPAAFLKLIKRNSIISTSLADHFPTLVITCIRKNMSEQKITDHNVSHTDRDDTLCKPGMTVISIRRSTTRSNLTGMAVTQMTFHGTAGCLADQFTEICDLIRIRSQFTKRVIKNSDADFCELIKVF